MDTFTADNTMLNKRLLYIVPFILLVLTACYSIRDKSVYKLELMYIERGLKSQNTIVNDYLQLNCCKGKKFKDADKQCAKALDTYLTIKSRTGYHTSMMRYLGRISEVKPKIPNLTIRSEGVCE